jgi:hypothetical protein
MFDSSATASTTPQPVDLLPWADPYILQLFRDSHLLEEGTDDGSASLSGQPAVTPGEKASSEAVLTGRSWSIRPLNRCADSRTRRTGSGRLMARC